MDRWISFALFRVLLNLASHPVIQLTWPDAASGRGSAIGRLLHIAEGRSRLCIVFSRCVTKLGFRFDIDDGLLALLNHFEILE